MIFAQSDAEKFAEGRAALDQYHDCPAAAKAMATVSSAGRNNPMWLFYMGKTEECLKRPSEALKYYEQYDKAVPGQAEVINKIGQLRYLARRASILSPLITWIDTANQNTAFKYTFIGDGTHLTIKSTWSFLTRTCNGTDDVDISDLDGSTIAEQATMYGYELQIRTRGTLVTSSSSGEACANGGWAEKNDHVWITVATREDADRGAIAFKEAITNAKR